MADQKITELPIKTSTGINLTDYLLGIDSAEGYQMLVSDIAKKIVEDYAGSTLLGTAQSVASALTQCMGLYGNTRITSGSDLNTIINYGTYYVQSSTDAANISNVPEVSVMRIYVTGARVGANNIQQVAYPYDGTYYYTRNGNAAGTSWGDWIKSPTRPEIDAMTTKFGPYFQSVDSQVIQASGTEYISPELDNGRYAMAILRYNSNVSVGDWFGLFTVMTNNKHITPIYEGSAAPTVEFVSNAKQIKVTTNVNYTSVSIFRI